MNGKKWRWPWLMALQALIASAAAALAIFLLPSGPEISGFLYGAVMWGVSPLAGALTAFFLVRKGVAAFAAFWLPPIFETLAHWLIAGFPPLSALMPITAALSSMIGAAAGEEVNLRGGKARGRQKKKKTGGATWRRT